MKIGIIGSGISGLSIANLLNNDHDVTIFEKESEVGGLVKCERVNDCLFHKVGGHVFNSRNEKISNWFWSYFDRDKEFVKAKRKAKIFINNQVIGYPIENYIYLFDKDTVEKIIGELLELYLQPVISPFAYDNFEDFLKGNFGNTLYQLYFKPYNQKLWMTDISTVSMQWLEGKLPMPNLQEILNSNVLRQEEEGMVHATFYYPKMNGSQFIANRLKQDLNIVNQKVEAIKIDNGKLLINSQKFDKIIYCADIRQMPKGCPEFLQNEGIDIDKLKNLRSNGTSNLFCETDDTDTSWMYIPEGFTKAHRIIYTGNFSESNNRGSKRKTCVVEFSGKVSYETMTEEIKKLPGNLTPLAYNYEANSYVIQDKDTRAIVGAARKALAKRNIYLLGRFAEWEYYNMDKAMEAAFTLFETEFNKSLDK